MSCAASHFLAATPRLLSSTVFSAYLCIFGAPAIPPVLPVPCFSFSFYGSAGIRTATTQDHGQGDLVSNPRGEGAGCSTKKTTRAYMLDIAASFISSADFFFPGLGFYFYPSIGASVPRGSCTSRYIRRPRTLRDKNATRFDFTQPRIPVEKGNIKTYTTWPHSSLGPVARTATASPSFPTPTSRDRRHRPSSGYTPTPGRSAPRRRGSARPGTTTTTPSNSTSRGYIRRPTSVLTRTRRHRHHRLRNSSSQTCRRNKGPLCSLTPSSPRRPGAAAPLLSRLWTTAVAAARQGPPPAAGGHRRRRFAPSSPRTTRSCRWTSKRTGRHR